MAEFDVSALMKDVSKVATGREQITYIPFDDIVPDEGNGYSMEGLDELARSIEIVGLQQPLRVRSIQGEPGRYRIVSGHRRRAAIGLVIKRGSKRFADGVPCIVDVSEASAALRELQLLLGNADNRKMTPADELQQAERISDCIRRLEDEGYKFPGRHREWVSKLSGLSRTKLGRLQAIKNNLVPELFHFFEIGQLNETAANELQKLPKEAQEAIAESCKRTGDAFFITSDAAAHCVKYAERYMAPCKCGNGDECDHHTRRFVQPLRAQYGWQRCSGECCLSCSELHQCKAACAKGRAKQKEDKETKAAEEAKASEKRAREDAKRQAGYRQQLQREAQRVLPLIEAAGLDARNTLRGRYSHTTVKVADVRKYAAGDFGDDHFYSGSFLPSDVAGLEEWAILLGCTLDFLIGRAETPQPVPGTGTEEAATWRTGEPPREGWYSCWATLKEPPGSWDPDYETFWWNGRFWAQHEHAKVDCGYSVRGWYPLPEGMTDDATDQETGEEDD